jgi:SAM-dependent methyltransferase
MSDDTKTADAFANSWNNLPPGSVYTLAQFEDWFAPLTRADLEGRTVLELGCGNGSLLYHAAAWNPALLEGIDLGASISSARRNLSMLRKTDWKVIQGDLTTYRGDQRDVVYCIGVLHHLKDPRIGFESVLANTKPGGRFHCWVYAREGNAIIIWLVDPLRQVASRLPWWFTKYLLATPLVAPYYVYAKLLHRFRAVRWLRICPLYLYSIWIAPRDFAFFRHVAFDQLVTPQTAYLDRATIEQWLSDNPRIVSGSGYVIFRNGNSWKFGGIAR